MEPLKLLIDAAVVRRLAARLADAAPGFDSRAFVRLAGRGLDALEFKARALQLCSALEATLPADFDAAARQLRPLLQGDDALQGWVLWPVGEFIARRGAADPDTALALLHALTQRFTAEFAIRPFVEADLPRTYATLARWVHDPDARVRRLVSEGTRPRLPWGRQLKALIADPRPSLPLLQALQDDPSEDVRRSVANHLNDIAKDHPALVADWLDTHLPGAPPARLALLRHACRTLVKQGDPRVLAAWGLGRRLQGQATLQVAPARIRLGESVTLQLALDSRSRQAQPLVVDYAVHHVKADGGTSPKVFKGWRLALPPRGQVLLTRRHAVRLITTRRYHAGRHRVEVQVNGAVVAAAEFELEMPS